VTAVRNYIGGEDMRDLTVAAIHTYYVIAGNEPVLVHNCDLTIAQEQLDTMVPGPHAKRQPVIETTAVDPLPQEIRDAVQPYACHTCNDTRLGAKPVKIGDHQPPKAFGFPGFVYRIFSHCSVCSRIQNLGVHRMLAIGRNHGISNPEGRYEELLELARQHVE
jgi:hypothetical protein